MTDKKVDEKWERLRPEAGRLSRGEKTKWLTTVLRMMIEDGELRHGEALLTESQIKKLYNISATTSQRSYANLAALGLVRKGQGRVPEVDMPAEALCRLIISRQEPAADQPSLAEVAEPTSTMELVPTANAPLDRPRWQEGGYAVPAWHSQLLGIEPGIQARTRTRIVSAGGKLILASTSLVAPDVFGEAVGWSDAQIGQLALAGVSIRYSEKMRVRDRPPTLAEEELLGITSTTRVLAIYRQCQIRVPNSTVRGPGCVLIVVNGDLVDVDIDE